MICVYPADCTDFSTNGNGTIVGGYLMALLPEITSRVYNVGL